MTQDEFLRAFDAQAHAAFAEAGLADRADYIAPDGAPMGLRRVYVNAGQQTAGEFGQVVAPRTAIGVLIEDGAVAPGGRLVVGASVYVLQRLDETNDMDGIIEWWVVRHG